MSDHHERVAESAERVVAEDTGILARLAEDDAVPQGWRDLIEGLMLLSKGAIGNDPTYCSHDNLTICSDPQKFSGSELDKLRDLGFNVDENNLTFESWRFGNA